MATSRSGGSLIIIGTFLVGLVFSQIPLPNALLWARPEFIPMILIFWVLVLPHRIGMGTAFLVGLALDLIKGSVLGLNALSLVTIAYLAYLLHQRMLMYPLWQQAFLVLVLVGINQLIFHWMQALFGMTGDSLLFLLPSLVSALIWPWLFLVLNGIRQLFRIG
ncbi:rod shape-determining protein MreD [Marinobacterium arenosum]|uniref:rod shape-determining protein MreD n=1 Tax=Marinobacterium arenosum TaxID=2862496 RepID=UPI001C93885F|nr:rod shape-determining protein MreD [Marinobacterium arenosum]MBY4676749.1 rod shape-determining protein MreD [Marinobacterium arenosum]